jgi:hypothetical protein
MAVLLRPPSAIELHDCQTLDSRTRCARIQ